LLSSSQREDDYARTFDNNHVSRYWEEKQTSHNLVDSSPSETEQVTGEETNAPVHGGQQQHQQQSAKRKSKSSIERRVRDDRSQPGRLVCRWSLVSKPENSLLTSADLLYSRTPETHFKADVPGKYVLLLTVKGHGTTYTEKVTFIVRDAAQPEQESLQEEESDENCIVLDVHFPKTETQQAAELVSPST
jgi:hypothetical protein